MSAISAERAAKILSSKGFRDLIVRRSRLRWSLTLVTLLVFFGFVLLVSAAPAHLAVSTPDIGIPAAMACAVAIIIAIVLSTGFYIWQSNTVFDALSARLRQEFDA